MPPAFEDNLSSCRSSPLHWKPVPVPAPVFDGFVSDLSAGEEINSWEQCMRILNSSRNGNSRFSCLEVMDDDLYVAASIHGQASSRSASMRSFSSSKNFQRSSSAYPVFGSTGSERMRRSSTAMNRYHVQSPESVPQNQSQATRAKDEELAEVKVEELAVTIRNNSTRDGGGMKSARMGSSISRVTWNSPTLQSEYSDFPTNRDFESIDEHQQQHSHEHSGSILKRIFQLGGKNRLSRSLSTTSSISHSRGGLPSDCRSKERGCFGGKAWMKRRKSPRLSSTDLGDVDPRVSSTNLTNDGISSACGDEEASVFGRNMMRWLQYQQLLAMATRAQNNLTELATMLQYAVKSLDDMKEMDEVAQEMHQKRNRCYYAS